MTHALVKFDAARQALAEARSIDEVKDIRNRAEALRLYSKQAGESLEMQNMIAEIKLRAERRAGELLKDQARNPGETDRTIMSQDVTLSPKLQELGISRKESSRWQQEASVPDEDFEQHIVRMKDAKTEVTSASYAVGDGIYHDDQYATVLDVGPEDVLVEFMDGAIRAIPFEDLASIEERA